MASVPPQRSSGNPRSARNQKRFTPRSSAASAAASSTASRDHRAFDSPNPPPSLTASLRASSSPPSRSGGNFVNYLPQDEAVASGLGGLDAEESQRVVDLLNDELSRTLKMSPRDFWREVARNGTLHEFLDSYLQFRHRWYDLPHRSAKGKVAGVVVGELELCRRVFMVLYRMSSNKDPGANANDCLSSKEHTALLQEKKLLDLPKLLDISAIYGHENGELTSLLVTNALRAQPTLLDHISSVVSHFLGIIHTMHQRCSSSLEVLSASGRHEGHGLGQLCKDFLEVIDFINDAIATLNSFADAYKHAAVHFCNSFELSFGNVELLSTLARLHDSLLPSLSLGFRQISHSGRDELKYSSDDTILSLKMLSMRIVKFGWKLLEFCYLSDGIIERNILQASTKMFPAKVEDPAIRGDILVQTFKEINKEVPRQRFGNQANCPFLQDLFNNHNILDRIITLSNNGWIFLDDDQFQYLAQIGTHSSLKSFVKDLSVPVPLNGKVEVDENAAILESKISQIKEIFPEYGKGFLLACLEVYNQNPEEVIQRILDGTLHDDLSSLDTSLEQIPPPKPIAEKRSDKGKGVLVEPASKSISSLDQGDFLMARRDTDGSPTASVSSSYGHYTRKSNNEVVDSAVLDSKTAKDEVRFAVLAAEYEYEDEYDDSFDDLGLSVVESGFEETDNLTDRTGSMPGKSLGSESENTLRNSNSRRVSQKKPQFYIKDGKNYSYKVSGSVGVFSSHEAAVLNQAQKELIHGLGRGGNIPLEAAKKLMDAEEQNNQPNVVENPSRGYSNSQGRRVRPHGAGKKLMDAEEQDNQMHDVVENSGRGYSNPRGRGGRSGGRNHYRKDQAMKKHFSSVGGF